MKTITVTFVKDGKIVAKAIGRFEMLPGEGPVIWNGPWTKNPPKAFRGKLPDHGYAACFVGAMQGMAERTDSFALVDEKGEWEVYEE